MFIQHMYINRSNQMSYLADGAAPATPVVVCSLELVAVARRTSYTKGIRPMTTMLLRSQVSRTSPRLHQRRLRSDWKAVWIGIASEVRRRKGHRSCCRFDRRIVYMSTISDIDHQVIVVPF